MANIAHASLTGAELHEPKGVTSAALGQVYVADGNGSGNWAGVGTSSFTGMIADFTWPVVQDGWLELDGSDISTTTYSALYDVMTIQMTGTRTSGNATITGLSSTANMRAGYYVFGTGIASGTTILTVDSGVQITLSGNASSSGSTTIVVSPWLTNTGTIRLPNVTTSGRFRRSRTSSTAVGQLQADLYKAHNHGGALAGTTDSVANHTHSNSLSDPGHSHNYFQTTGTNSHANGGAFSLDGTVTGGTSPASTGMSIINAAAGGHSHTTSATIPSDGSTETRPVSIVVMTCVKT